jgi:hypothetical protein
MTPVLGMPRIRRLAKAPRVLNEPACCMSSSFKLRRPAGKPNSVPSISIAGVRRMRGRISRSAAAIASLSIAPSFAICEPISVAF